MKWILQISILILWSPVFLIAQKEVTSEVWNIYWEKAENCYYHVYEPSLKIEALYQNVNQVVNQFPEQLMVSIASENTKEWINYNRDFKIEKDFLETMLLSKKQAVPGSYYELTGKLTIDVDGEEYAIVQFVLYSAKLDKKIPGAFPLKRDKGKWKLSHNADPINSYMNMFRSFKPNLLKKIFRRDFTINTELEKLGSKILVEGNVDLNKLNNEFRNWSFEKTPKEANYFLNEIKIK